MGGLYQEIILDNLDYNEELNLDGLRQLIIRLDKKKIVDRTNAAIDQLKNWNTEYRIRHNNKTIWLREQAQFDFEQRSPLIDLFISDVTEFKKQNRQLKNKLSSAAKTADQKNEFFASMSHEIRTPMNAVMGMAQILTKTQMDYEQQQYLGTIVNASHSLVQIINDILDVSKLEAGKIDLLSEEIDLEELCLDVCHLLTMRAEEKNLHLYLDFKPINKKRVYTDAGRVRQILINLIGNALKFTEQGYVILTVELTPTEEHYKFSVRDTGIGIPEEAQKSVFEAFSQADATITKNFGGTGLGLQICQKLVGLMKGNIGVESEVDKGSTFWFSLPLQANEESNKVNLTGSHGMLVDNAQISLELMEKTVASVGASATKISDAEDVLAILTTSDNQFDFFLIDKDMDGLDGLKLASLVKSDPRYINIPIILMTSMTAKLNSQKMFESGVNAYLTKPVSSSVLLKAINTAKTINNQSEAVYVSNKNDELDDEHENNQFSAKALVADDLEVNQFILNSMLSKFGVVADFANNGLEALDKVKNNHYDLIFMDCRMPVMDGFEATRRLKVLSDEKSKIPVIALTANMGESDKQACYDAGMDGFLSKPYVESDILNTIKEWVSGEKVSVSDAMELSTEETQTPVLDLNQFEAIQQTLGDGFLVFAESMPAKFSDYHAQISDALLEGSMQMVHEKSHALKGLSALIGATMVSSLASSLEEAGKDKNLELANLSLSKLSTAISEFNEAILQYTNPDIEDAIVLF